jgi:hypothetical protein
VSRLPAPRGACHRPGVRWLVLFLVAGGCTGSGTMSDALVLDAASGTDQSAIDAGTSDSAQLAPLIPLAAGETWRYTLDQSGFGTPTTCTETTQIGGTIDVDGRHAFVETISTVCPGLPPTMGTFYTAGTADRYETRAASGTTWYVQDPPSEGHTWNSGAFDYVWHRAPSQSVPAGTFADCWTETTMPGGSNQQFTFCRGVGLVGSLQTFSTGLKDQSALTSKSF